MSIFITLFISCFYIVAINNNILLSPLKLKWFTNKSKHYFTLGSDIFKKVDDDHNFALINSNFIILYRYITHYSTKFIVPINKFIKKEDLNIKVSFIVK